MTSGDVTAEFLRRERCGKKVYLVGTDELRREFVENGIRLSDGTDGSADIVVTSFDTSLDYRKLERACTYVRGGAEYFSTHPDLNCPTENGFIPDSGAVSAFCHGGYRSSAGISRQALQAHNRYDIRKIRHRPQSDVHFRRPPLH